MAYERSGESSLEYNRCRYGHSKIMFRGPKRDISGDFTAFIGGTETFGKYVEQPFPDLVQEMLGMPCVNFGAVNAGVDSFLNDRAILEICEKSAGVVIQVLGAHNMSNRFYSVHSRRNDRFLRASTLLQTIYREVDFSEFAFTQHMLNTLKLVSAEKFATVEAELQTAWTARMQLFLSKIKAPKILLWVADRSPDNSNSNAVFGGDPLFINRAMIEELRPSVSDIVEVCAPSAMVRKTEGMLYPELEEKAAAEIIGPEVHSLVAEHVHHALTQL